MKKIKTAMLQDKEKICVSPKENTDFYYELEGAILLSMLNSKIINQIQYELCEKELINKKYNLWGDNYIV